MKKLFALFLILISLNAVNAQEYDITKFGIKQDSTVLQTKAIQKVIDRAFSKGGGTIVIPKGTYLSGALFFKKKNGFNASRRCGTERV